MSQILRTIRSPYFWKGFVEAWSIPAVATIAFAGVWRRGFKGDFPAVIYDSKSMWWTEAEKTARWKKLFSDLDLASGEADAFPEITEGPVH